MFYDKIEYDVRFDTNNLGFVDDKDYVYEALADKKYYAFVGDSFTAGFHGGAAWIPKLRNKLQDTNVEIYNLGISATGIKQVYRVLQSTNEQLNFTHIVILAISDDFGRATWYPLVASSEIRLCRENTIASACMKNRSKARIIHPDASSEEILEIADQVISDGRARAEKNKNQRDGIRGFLKRSELLVLAVKMMRRSLINREKQGLEALRNIRETFPSVDIHFIHLPQKGEILNGDYTYSNVGQDIEEIGITYFSALTECDWRQDMFFENDGHPNNIGYDNIEKCVANYLF